jgi:hypothetical protein
MPKRLRIAHEESQRVEFLKELRQLMFLNFSGTKTFWGLKPWHMKFREILL